MGAINSPQGGQSFLRGLNDGASNFFRFQQAALQREALGIRREAQQFEQEQAIKEQKVKLDALKAEQNKQKRSEELQQRFLQLLGGGAPPGSGQGQGGQTQQAQPQPQPQPQQQSPQQGALLQQPFTAQPELAASIQQLQQPAAQPRQEGPQPAAQPRQEGPQQFNAQQLGALNALASQVQGGRQALEFAVEHGLIQTPQSIEARKFITEARANKEKLASFLEQRAGSAATPAQKADFQQGALVVRTAGPDQIAGFLSKQFPTVQSATDAFQALIRTQKDPLEAFKTLEKIEADNKIRVQNSKPIAKRTFGVDLESLSAANYDGKQFIDLTPAQRQKVIEERDGKRVAEAKAKVASIPVPADIREELQQTVTLGFAVQDLVDKFNPEYFGKVNFIGNKLAILRGSASPELVAYVSLYNNAIDKLARLRTGAVISDDDKATFERILGSTFDEPGVGLARLQTFLTSLRRAEQLAIDLATTPGAELRSVIDKRQKEARQEAGISVGQAPQSTGQATGQEPGQTATQSQSGVDILSLSKKEIAQLDANTIAEGVVTLPPAQQAEVFKSLSVGARTRLKARLTEIAQGTQ